MNTKATAPAAAPVANKPAVAPTAKAANGAAGKQEDDLVFTPITEEEDNEYNSLLKRHLDLNDEEDDRFHTLAKKIREAKNKRNAFIGGIKTKLTSAAASIKDLFNKEEIKAAYKITDLFDQAEIDAAATKKASGKGTKSNADDGEKKTYNAKVFASSSNPVFIKIPRVPTDHQKVKDVIIHQGRTNEFYQGKSIFGALPAPLMRLKGKTAEETKANLDEYIVDKDYAKKPEGMVELDKIVNAVFTYVKK